MCGKVVERQLQVGLDAQLIYEDWIYRLEYIRREADSNDYDAYVAGFEVIARVGEMMNFEHYANGWHATATIGALGATAAVLLTLMMEPPSPRAICSPTNADRRKGPARLTAIRCDFQHGPTRFR